MLFPGMQLQVVTLCEFQATNGALVRLFPGVQSHVTLQIATVVELLLAPGAAKITLQSDLNKKEHNIQRTQCSFYSYN